MSQEDVEVDRPSIEAWDRVGVGVMSGRQPAEVVRARSARDTRRTMSQEKFEAVRTNVAAVNERDIERGQAPAVVGLPE